MGAYCMLRLREWILNFEHSSNLSNLCGFLEIMIMDNDLGLFIDFELKFKG